VNARLQVECSADGVCPEAPMPDGLPTEDEAKARARELWTSAGMDISDADIRVDVSAWGVWVSGEGRLDGRIAEGLAAYASFGDGGGLDSAGGWLATPQAGDTYDLLAVGDAAAVLSDPGYWAMPGDLARTREVAVEEGSVDPALVDPVPLPAPIDEPAVDPSLDIAVDPAVSEPAEPMVVQITGAELIMSIRYSADGAGYFVPAYRLLDADGGWWTVDALPSDLLAG
jgi:hypothetical protein